MIRKYHNHKPQTTPWHLEEEPLNHHETPGRQIKQSNQLSLPYQDDCNTSNIQQNIEQLQKSHFALQIYDMDTFTYISPVLEAFHQVEDILAVQLVASLAVQVVASLAVLEGASLVGLEAPSLAGLVVPFLVVGTQHLQVGDILAEEGELHLITDKIINIRDTPVFCLWVCFDALHPSQ